MPMMTLEVREVENRMKEVIDTILQGHEVSITHFGEVVAVCRLHDPACLAPRTWLESAMLKGFDELLERLRDDDARPHSRGN
jgi:antitoxin (DNA-binding transcriptional repressor) of toxin-antitoxin stability system